MTDSEAKDMMRKCFTEESEGLHRSYATHREAIASYKVYLEKVDYAWKSNKEMSLMSANSIHKYLATQNKAFSSFYPRNLEDKLTADVSEALPEATQINADRL